MNEETRKEFEEWAIKLGMITDSDSVGKYESYITSMYFEVWKASREAMKPIKLPKLMKNTQEQPCYYYNDAVEECKEAIQQAGYKVE